MEYVDFLFAMSPQELARQWKDAFEYAYTTDPDKFNGPHAFADLMARSWVIPWTAAISYVAIVFGGQAFMKNRESYHFLKHVGTFWNFLLATFSWLGAIITVPILIRWVMSEGVEGTVCQPGGRTYLSGVCGLVSVAFILSKIPELFDTVLLVFQKKPVIFLHWYHHVTVMLYSWHALSHNIANGLWFIAMNASVHAVMYLYFGCMSLSPLTRRLVSPFGMFITLMQISQMVGGMFIIVYTQLFIPEDPRTAAGICVIDEENQRYGLVMYTSYFLLFAKLFYDHNISSKGKQARRAKLEGKPKKD